MRVLEAERSRGVATGGCGYGQALLKINVRTLQEFLLVGVNEIEAVLVVCFDVKACGVTVTILALTTGEA